MLIACWILQKIVLSWKEYWIFHKYLKSLWNRIHAWACRSWVTRIIEPWSCYTILSILTNKVKQGRRGTSDSLIPTLKCFSVPAVLIEFVRHVLERFLMSLVKKDEWQVFETSHWLRRDSVSAIHFCCFERITRTNREVFERIYWIYV